MSVSVGEALCSDLLVVGSAMHLTHYLSEAPEDRCARCGRGELGMEAGERSP